MRTITTSFVRLIQASAVASLLLVGAGCAPAPQKGGPAVSPTPVSPSAGGTVLTGSDQAPSPDDQVPVSGGPTGTMLVRPDGNSIYVAAQRPGKTVKVTMLSIKSPGFVVIREKDAVSGKELGKSALLPAGDDNGTVIDLDRVTKDGETLYAAVYADDGDGVFGPSDAPVTDGQKDPLSMTFEVSATASENPVINF